MCFFPLYYSGFFHFHINLVINTFSILNRDISSLISCTWMRRESFSIFIWLVQPFFMNCLMLKALISQKVLIWLVKWFFALLGFAGRSFGILHPKNNLSGCLTFSSFLPKSLKKGNFSSISVRFHHSRFSKSLDNCATFWAEERPNSKNSLEMTCKKPEERESFLGLRLGIPLTWTNPPFPRILSLVLIGLSQHLSVS